MPVWVWRYIQPEKKLDDEETVVIDLPKKELISALKVKVSATNISGGNAVKLIHDLIDQFQVVGEGRTALHVLPPWAEDYIYFVEQGDFPPHVFDETGDATQRGEFYILFGRGLGDPEMILDTGQYSGVQLRFKFELDTSYFASGSGKLEVLALVPMVTEGVSPKGFVRRSTLLTRDTVADKEYYHELPIGLPYRRVSLRVYKSATAISSILSKVWLRLNEGKIKYFEYNIAEWLELNKYLYRYPIDIHAVRYRADSANVATPLAELEEVDPVVGSANPYTLAVSAINGNQYTLQVYDAAGSAVAAASKILEAIEGYFPWHCISIIDEAHWGAPFPSTQFTKVEIAEIESVADAEVTPILEEYAPLKI